MKTHKVKCKYCPARVERVNIKQGASCFNCKVKRVTARANELRNAKQQTK